MPTVDFQQLVRQTLIEDIYESTDWLEWRYCYEGGNLFRDEYLRRFSDLETLEEYNRRREMTPIPSYARREINRVKNSLSQRFPDITRREGTKVWRDAVAGLKKGVDRRGASMNAYIAKYLLAELLVMGRVGILVDAPKVRPGATLADVKDFRPYFNRYRIERIPVKVPAEVDSPSEWKAVLLEDQWYDIDIATGSQRDRKTFRYYWLDDTRGNLVSIQKLDENGQEMEAKIETDLEAIPFVMLDIGGSLIRDVCSYQIALLNMISADSNYAVDSNYSFMVRQRGNNNAGAFLIGEGDDEAATGPRKGLFYDKGLEAPQFISPPTDPMKASLELRKELKNEIRELVTGAIADLGEDGSIDAGLAFIGTVLADGENRLCDHWAAYEQKDPEKRKPGTVSYPEEWALKTDEERITEADTLLELMNKLPGQQGKKEAAKMAYDKLYRGKLPTPIIDAIKTEVDGAPYTTSNHEIILGAVENGVCSAETAAVALGFNPGEAEKAQEDQAKRAEMIVAAQADAAGGAARGAKDLSANPNSNKLARKGEADPAAKLGGALDKGVRGKANP
jgi:hypothetical protein